MPNKFRLKSLSVEGFRGINQKFNLTLNGKSIVINGPNGVGKSSLLQAIEWGLFGWLPHISGGEFEQEDAIVNQFHPNETAIVELTFESPQIGFRIVRTRKKSKWSRRKSYLTLELEDTTYKGRKAEEKTRELIGLTEDEFYASTYLHQETLRDFITGDINTRNAVIDKMLGTYSLTEITKGLPTTKLKRITDDLRERIQSLKASELSRFSATRAKLKDYKKELDSQKISEEELQVGKLNSQLNNLRTQIDELAHEFDVVITHLETPKEDLATIQKTIASLRKNLSEIETKRFQRYDNLVNRVSFLKSSKNQVNDLRERLKNLKATYRFSLKEKMKEIAERIRTYQSQQKELREQLDFLHNKNIELNNYASNLKSLLEREEKITSEYGELEKIKKRLVQVESETESLHDQINKMEAYSQLVTQAAGYIENQKPDICPICKNQIVPLNIAENLRHEISKTEAGAKILELTQTLNQRSEETRNLQRVQVQLEDLNKAIDEAKNKLQRCKHDIIKHTKLSEVDTEAIRNSMTQLNSELDQLTSSQDKIAQEKLRLENAHSEQKRLEKSLSDLNQKVRSELMIESDAELLEAISEVLDDVEKKLDKFRKLNSRLQGFTKRVERLEQVLGFLLLEAEVLRLEEEFPELEALIRSETEKYDKLAKIRDGLIQIRQAALEEQRSFITYMLRDLESGINHFYKKLMGHAYYTDISLDSETQRNKNIYWIKAKGADYETHVRTRFSNTQLNATAIAIFNSASKQLPHNLDFVIFDDPFQSMDQHHQDALIEKLAEDAKERQIIIATHENVLLERLQKSISPGKTVKITDWSTQGPLIS